MTKVLYTSYFAKSGKEPFAYAITVHKPSWFNGSHFPDLAPTSNMLSLYKRGVIGEVAYSAMYLKELEKRGRTPQEVADKLPDGAILLCFEGIGKYCHRHLAADWLRAGGVNVQEL